MLLYKSHRALFFGARRKNQLIQGDVLCQKELDGTVSDDNVCMEFSRMTTTMIVMVVER